MNARRWIAPLVTGLAGAAFVGLALFRRLNFDESLALRAGWLDLAGEPAAPAFLMPWTLLAGAVGHALADPGAVLICLRALAAGGVAAAFVIAAHALGLSGARLATASWLALANATFLTHALEFRYDAAVLALLLLGTRELVREGSRIPLGALAGLLALHHLKGLYYAVGLVALQLLLSGVRRRALRELLLGAVGVLAAWVALLASLGLLSRFVESIHTFLSLAGGGRRAPVTEALGPVLLGDLAWWLAVLVALALGVRRRGLSQQGASVVVPAALAALGVAFWLVHPHAWAYLAALPVPFLVFASVPRMAEDPRARTWTAAAYGLGMLLQTVATAASPLGYVGRALAAPMAPDVALLRGLREEVAPEDRILDPSGIVYFVPPCVEEWYLDTLFVDRVRAGTWMAELARGLPPRCTVALATYRLNALPRAAREALAREFVPLASGLAVRRERPVDRSLFELPGDGRVESFW